MCTTRAPVSFLIPDLLVHLNRETARNYYTKKLVGEMMRREVSRFVYQAITVFSVLDKLSLI